MPAPTNSIVSATIFPTANARSWPVRLFSRLQAFNKAEAEWARMEHELQTILQSAEADPEERMFLPLAA